MSINVLYPWKYIFKQVKQLFYRVYASPFLGTLLSLKVKMEEDDPDYIVRVELWRVKMLATGAVASEANWKWGTRLIKNLDKQKKVFGIYKFAKNWWGGGLPGSDAYGESLIFLAFNLLNIFTFFKISIALRNFHLTYRHIMFLQSYIVLYSI